jgi:hypothetical protein
VVREVLIFEGHNKLEGYLKKPERTEIATPFYSACFDRLCSKQPPQQLPKLLLLWPQGAKTETRQQTARERTLEGGLVQARGRGLELLGGFAGALGR